jgi:small-conductance mechanosensitive channel
MTEKGPSGGPADEYNRGNPRGSLNGYFKAARDGDFERAANYLDLDNLGYDVSTLLTGLGVGGLAVALAAQDTLKNFIASIMILVDKPYRIGQRIVVKGHEGMDPELPPRVYFDEFKQDCLNIVVFYWYHPPEYWDFLDFIQRINLRIMRAFKEEGIEFAFPTTTTHLSQDDAQPLRFQLAAESRPEDH